MIVRRLTRSTKIFWLFRYVAGSPRQILFARINLVEAAAVGEMLLLRLAPAAKNFIDGHQLQLGELLAVLAGNRRIAGPVVMPGGNSLALFGIQVVEVGLSSRLRSALLDNLRVGRES